MQKPDNTPIRHDTKRKLKMRAAYHGLSLVDYLDAVLNHYFDQSDEGSTEDEIVKNLERKKVKIRKEAIKEAHKSGIDIEDFMLSASTLFEMYSIDKYTENKELKAG